MPSQDTMKAAMQAYVDRTNAGDAPGLLALFAPGATVEDPVGSPLKRGEQINAWFADAVAFGTRIIKLAPIRGSHGDEAALVPRRRVHPHPQARANGYARWMYAGSMPKDASSACARFGAPTTLGPSEA